MCCDATPCRILCLSRFPFQSSQFQTLFQWTLFPPVCSPNTTQSLVPEELSPPLTLIYKRSFFVFLSLPQRGPSLILFALFLCQLPSLRNYPFAFLGLFILNLTVRGAHHEYHFCHISALLKSPFRVSSVQGKSLQGAETLSAPRPVHGSLHPINKWEWMLLLMVFPQH